MPIVSVKCPFSSSSACFLSPHSQTKILGHRSNLLHSRFSAYNQGVLPGALVRRPSLVFYFPCQTLLTLLLFLGSSGSSEVGQKMTCPHWGATEAQGTES